MIKGIIFDMDGVMIDTELQSNLGWLWAASQKNVEMPMWLIDSFKGGSPENSAKTFDEYYKGSQNYWEMRDMRTEHVYDIRKTEGIPVKKGLHNLLEYIRTNGLKCAVATSTRRESAEKSLHNIGAWEYLSAVAYGDEIENSKPAPDIFLKAANDIGILPSECIVIEDSINGIKAGRAAGMTVVHVPDTIAIEDDIKALTDVICQDLDEVISVIEDLNGNKVLDRSKNSAGTTMNLAFVDRVRVKNTFANYTEKYDATDPKIKLKIDHTYRVAALCERIAKSAGMCAYDVELAWLSGMLHDVGRFEQIRRFNTFSDADSVDHAQLGADILFKDGLIHEFMGDMVKISGLDELNKSDLDIVELAIRNHSAYRVQDGLNEREQMFCDILRDADKVDILRVNVETPLEDIYNTTTEILKSCEVTKEVMDAFDEEHCVLRSLKKTPIDNVVGHISLTYELVYAESLRLMRNQGYLDKLMGFESNNPITKKQFAHIQEKMNQYMDRKINDTSI